MEKSAVIADERPAGVEGEEGDSRGKEKVRSGSWEGGPKKESESSISEERMGRAMKEATADVSDDNSENVSDDWYGNDDADLEKGTTLSRVKIYTADLRNGTALNIKRNSGAEALNLEERQRQERVGRGDPVRTDWVLLNLLSTMHTLHSCQVIKHFLR